MTRVQLLYKLSRPVDDVLMKNINNAHALYGIEQIKLQPSLDQILVEYDASVLSIDKVENNLHRAGIPATRVVTEPANTPPSATA